MSIIKLRSIKQALSIKNYENIYQISGRVMGIRDYKNKSFVDLVDGSSPRKLQVVLEKKFEKPHLGAYVKLEGVFVASPGHQQEVELKTNRILFYGPCSNFPFSFKKDEEEYVYRNHPHLRPRAPSYTSLLRIRSEFEFALHQIMRQMDFFKVHTPTLTSNDSEASADLFRVERTSLKADKRVIKPSYFDKEVFLLTSGQLHLEMLAASLSRVYTLANTFRAENSETRRHLSEFSMIEAEESDVTELDKLMDRVETIIKFVWMYLSDVSEYNTDFQTLIKADGTKLGNEKYIRMTYKDALKILNAKYGDDINRPAERQLLKHCNNVPIFITHYPINLKPFYMKVNDATQEAECFDLIAPFGGEICGGSLREHRLDKLEQRLAAAKQSQHALSFDWYIDSRRFGTFPHGGFGIGFDRLLQAMFSVSNIRDVNMFPRWPNYCPM